MRRKNIQVSLTSAIPKPNEYILSLQNEYSQYAYNEERCLGFKGQWRSQAFEAPVDAPMDLEIGTGNGTHFAHHVKTHTDRFLLGIELKYKPLIQTIRRAVKADCGSRARVLRYNALLVDHLFEKEELNDVYIHFPDPWEKKKKTWKHRIVSQEFLTTLHPLQKPKSFVQFKTDSKEYFDWFLEQLPENLYEVEMITRDLHKSEYANKNFCTQFESIFLAQNKPIYYLFLRKKNLAKKT